jgi:K+/H+ antiporter YhaU regulatory subunit KhtT
MSSPEPKKLAHLSVYQRIAVDIAYRIVRGELVEGSRLSGRTKMSSEYGVSPETIRRSFSLLQEMEVVEVKPASGVFVLSRVKAQHYIDRHGHRDMARELQAKMRSLIEENERLGRLLNTTMRDLIDATDRFRSSNPFLTHESTVSQNSPLDGKTLGSVRFWQQTGATVIAIRRESSIILSPGPDFVLSAEDVLVFIGGVDALTFVASLTAPL